MARMTQYRSALPIAPGPISQKQFGDAYLMLEAARAFFIEGLSQASVAARLGLSQTSVSRLLSRAREDGVIEFHLRPRPEFGLAHELADKLRHTCVKRVVVVPGGSGKNEGNLAGPAAATILDELARMRDRDIRITAAGGRTVHAVFEAMILGLTSLSEWKEHEHALEFYPAVLGTDSSIDPSYPGTQVTSLAVIVNRAFGRSYPGDTEVLQRAKARNGSPARTGPRAATAQDSRSASGRGSRGSGKFRIKACAPSLPPNFYSFDADERAHYLERYGVNAVMDEARKSQLFVVGIGRADDFRYRDIMESMNPAFLPRLDDACGEVGWVPFDADGQPLADIEKDLVAIKPAELRALASAPEPAQQVIAVAGGDQKLDAIEAAFVGKPWFSTFVTDVINARRLLDSKRVGDGR